MAALPDWFDVVGVTARNAADRELLAGHGIAAHPDLDGLLGGSRERPGVYDFDDVQYRSWVRSPAVLLRGERGELRDDAVRRVGADGQPRVARLERVAAGGAGSHEGLFLRGYLLDGDWAYRNPFRPARLADEDLGVAHLLARTALHVLAGGPSPYEVAEAAQDQYLQLVVREAAASGAPVRALRQEWADGTGCRGR
jgi:hypothetical protein